jgi:hypothetical protein
VAQTEEVTRAVVAVNVDSVGEVHVDVSVPADDTTEARSRLTSDEFFGQLATYSSESDADFARRVLEDFEARPGFRVGWGTASFIIKYESPSDGKLLTLLVVTRDNKVYPGWLDQQLPRSGYDLEVGKGFVRNLADAVGGRLNPKSDFGLDGNFSLSKFSSRYEQVNEAILDLTAALGAEEAD